MTHDDEKGVLHGLVWFCFWFYIGVPALILFGGLGIAAVVSLMP
jgi:hypothetical protein